MPFTPLDHTFVVCAYKENEFLSNTIETLLNQTKRCPILISTSTPNAHISKIAEQYEIPLIINPSPNGAAGDWNYGYDHAQTPLITIAHQDDYYDPRYLETMLLAINNYAPEDIQFAFSDYFEIRNNTRVNSNMLLRIKRILNAPLQLKAFNGSVFVKRRTLSLGNPICCPAVMLFKENLGDNVFDITYKNSCDYKTWADLAEKPGRFIYVPKPLVGHRIYEESSTSLNLKEGIRQSEDLEILASFWPSYIAKLIYKVYALGEKSNQI